MFGYITSDIDNLQVGTIYEDILYIDYSLFGTQIDNTRLGPRKERHKKQLFNHSQRFSHVFSAESKDKASEILTAICKGYKEGMKQPQGKEIVPSKTGTQKKKEGASKQKARREASDKKVCVATFVFVLPLCADLKQQGAQILKIRPPCVEDEELLPGLFQLLTSVTICLLGR